MNGEVLLETEELFQALIQNSSDLVALIDGNGVCRFQSPSSETILGYLPAELVGRCVFDFVHPQDVAASRGRFGEVLAGGRDPSACTELRFRHKDGSWRVIEVKCRPLSGRKDNSLYVFNSRDITARMDSEEALRESERRYRALFDSANDGIILHGLDGRILQANRVAAERLGRTHTDLLGMNVRDVRSPEAAGDFVEQMGEIAAKGSAIFETRHRGPDGGSVPVEVSSRLLDDRDGGLVLSISRDITERKKAEESVRTTQAQLEAAMEVADLASWEMDVEAGIFTFNDRFYTLYGTTAEREGGYQMPAEQYAERFVHPDERQVVAEEVQKAVMTTDPDYRPYVEHRIVRPDGEVRHMAVRYVVTKDEGGRTIKTHGANQDITKRRRTEEALRESEERFRAIFEQGSVGIALLDTQQRFLRVNPSFARFLGYEDGELTNRRMEEVTAPSDIEPSQRESWALLAGGRTGLQIDKQYRRKSGDLVWGHVSATVLRGKDGLPIGTVAVVQNISERKQAESLLRLTQFSIDHAADAVLWTDPAARLLFVSDSLCDSLGYTREELLGMTLFDIDPSLVESRWSENWARIKSRGSFAVETIHRRKDGATFPVEVSVNYLAFEDREYNCAIARDITERKESETAARRTSAYNRSLIEAALDPLVTIGPNGAITDVNEATLTVTGCSREELVGADFSEYFTDPKSARSGYEQVFALGHVRDYPLTIRGKDGTLTEVLYNASLYRDEEGRPVGVLAAARDVTERTRSEEKLRASEERFRAFYENSPDAVFITSPDGRIHAANSAACTMFGMTQDELVATGRDSLIDATDPRLGPALRKRQRTGRYVGELTFRRKLGTVFPGEVASQVYSGDDGELYTAMIVRDLTERKRGEEALALAEAQLRQAQKMEAVGQLAGGIAHDFNNLLTAIIGNSELMLQALPFDDPNRELAADVREVGQRAAALTRQILAFSRRQMLKPEVLCLNDIVQEVEPLLRRTLGEDVRLQVLLTPDLPSTEVDPSQMEQVLMNLALNARDAMPQGGELVIETANVDLDRAYCKIRSEMRPGRYVLLAVSDNGCGMDEETRSRIFEPFFTTKEVGKGTGLGLSTVFGIVRQSGGSVSVYSELHKGTTFKVYLPVCQGSEPRDDDPVPGHELTKGTETVLVVEDEAPVRELIVRVLSLSGYRVLEAGSAAEVAAVLEGKGSALDLLLTDVVLPGGKSGHEVVEDVHACRPGLPVIFMSGYAQDSAVFNGSLSKEADFLEKPFAPGQLLERVRGALDRALAKLA